MSEEEKWQMVQGIAEQTNCEKRKVGCLILDEHDTIVSTGYNFHMNFDCDCIPGPSTAAHAEDMAVVGIPAAYKDTYLVAYVNHKPCDRCVARLEEAKVAIVYKELSERLKTDTEQPDDVEELIEEREHTHGDFEESSEYVQNAKTLMHKTPNWIELDGDQKESLHMIQHKIGRILYGDHNFLENWRDISGYATLVKQRLETTEGAKDIEQTAKVFQDGDWV